MVIKEPKNTMTKANRVFLALPDDPASEGYEQRKQLLEMNLTSMGLKIVNPAQVQNDVMEFCKQYAVDADMVANTNVLYIGMLFIIISMCDAIYFCKGWASDPTMVMLYKMASVYGLTIWYEDLNEKA